MSENEQEIREAAATGAAAAVEAVVDQQHEDENREAVEASAVLAGESALVAEEQAETATAAATAALTDASEAHARAAEASATAEQAASEAEAVRSDVEQIRDYVAAGFTELRTFITESLAPKEPTSEPTEVVVTHHGSDSGQDTGTGDNAGSGGSPTTTERPYRHRFGRRS